MADRQCFIRADGAAVHAGRPLRDERGNLIGHTCDCGTARTPSGGVSSPGRMVRGVFHRSKSHRARNAALGDD